MSEAERRNAEAGKRDRLVRERVGGPLRPERLRSLLMVVPAASGDVALATTVVRHVKEVNPGCRVSFATRRANVPLIRMCPGVDETLEMPHAPAVTDKHGWKTLSRRRLLADHAGRADAVVCTCFFPEDADLLTEHGFHSLEAVWLLAGVPEGMPPGPQKVWLRSPLAAGEASAVIRRSLGRQARAKLVLRGAKRLPESLALMARAGSVAGSGIKVVPRDLAGLRNVVETFRPVHRRRLDGGALDRDFVLLSTEATSLPAPPRGVVRALVGMLAASGRTVLHNVMDPLHAAPGTVALVCSYPEFLGLRQAGVPFVGWRSGLCDVAAASGTPMCVLAPPAHDWYKDVSAMFGLRAMNLDADCLEVVCRDVGDVERSGLIDYLQQRTNE